MSKAYYRDDSYITSVGLKIRELRLSKSISQEALANDCEIDYSQVNRMESGKVNFSLSYLKKIADALKVDPKDLLP